jgi:hypothetical protein
MYYVVENTPGYLPEGGALHFDTLADAEAYRDSLATELVEQGYIVTLNDFIVGNDSGRIYLDTKPFRHSPRPRYRVGASPMMSRKHYRNPMVFRFPR